MRHPRPALLLLLGILAGFARGADATTSPIAAQINAWMAKDGPPGVAVVLRQAGQTSFHTYGFANVAAQAPVTPDSVFELASITKVFTTTLLALADNRGELSLDDLLIRHLPALGDGHDITRVTLRQLATHTSSLPRAPSAKAWAAYTRDKFFTYLRDWRADRPPGTKNEYSNIGIGLLGLVLEARHGRPFMPQLDADVLAPLGMHATAMRRTPALGEKLVQGYGAEKLALVPRTTPTVWPASGALVSSARDMARFLEANLGEFSSPGSDPAPTPLMTAMERARAPLFRVNDRFTQALAWQVFRAAPELTIIDKNGGLAGTSTYIGFIPDRHLGLVILANRGKQDPTPLGRQLLVQLARSASAPTATP